MFQTLKLMIQKRANPVIVNEMRTRMRGKRAYVILTLYLVMLSCLIGSLYTSLYDSASYSTELYQLNQPNVQNGPNIGKTIFAGTSFLLLILVSHIAPAFTAAAIAGERERQTFEVLLITPMKAIRIVWGKLGAVFLFLFLIIMTSLPIQSLAFLFGGVALTELLIATLVLVATALMFGAIGLYISSLSRTTMSSIIITYSIVLPILYGLPFLVFFLASFFLPMMSIFGATSSYRIFGIIYAVVMMYAGGFILCLNPFSAAFLSFIAAANGKGYFFFTEQIDYNITVPLVSPWLIYVIIYILLTLLLVRLTARRLEKISNI